MTDPSLRESAVRLYDDFTHEHRDRRTLLREMTALAGSAAAAEALIAAIGASPAAAAITAPDDRRLLTQTVRATAAGKSSIAYLARPKAGGRKLGTVMVIHENRGLNDHIRDVARRIALAGFRAVAPDFLAPWGGTPADEDKARDMIAKVDYDLVIAQGLAILAEAKRGPETSGKGGVIGFCWGGALVNRLAVAGGKAIDAAVAYYGPAPAPAEAAKVEAPMLLHYAGKDARVAQTGEPWVAALKAAGKRVESFTYPGVDHAFNNDTSVERYDKAAADLAWGRSIAFLHKYLDA
ncbi:dienelactone hydrolase family protein [Sphingomonas sp. CL5.1]|uniref:dienelactone hydrolase family protein n=1 Tax=Sphingomonas sp. CL5.1 TaxID=2653203 RepID=UPI0015830DC0|nr:dienelactone hydrolase family protein [Sphingomonas sp. CL5.1]QKS01851.1 dienelactone hydrolase family protein [Sphingomonas sp. CL5.1]